MSTGERVAGQYRGLTTDQLREQMRYAQGARRRAAIQLLLKERAEARERGVDAANLMLSVVGAGDIGSHIPRARAAMARAAAAKDFNLSESAAGFAQALLEYRAEQGR